MVYDIKTYSSTDLAKNSTLIQSLLSKNPTWTDTDARRAIDQAWGIMEECQKRKNKATEQPIVDHEPCTTCGSTQFIRTGVCFTCSNCASSSSCS